MTLGQLLKSARVKQGRTLRGMESGTGISNGYLSQLESDHVKQPSPKHLYKLADTLALDYQELMRLAGYVTVTGAISRRSTGSELAGMEDLGEEDRAKVNAYIQDLRDARRLREQGG